MTSEPAIRTFGLTKHYGDVLALSDLGFDVPKGIVFGYLGPNGSGKTTTIRMLAGLVRPTRGRAEVLGMDPVADRDQVQARVGYLPGDFVAYPNLTGAEYLTYLGNLRGMSDLSYAELLAKRLRLDLTRPIGELSHGNRQKVGLVQAFMHEPDLLLLDEPTSGLDPLIQQEFLALVREARDAGRTVLLSSHILDEVEAVADVVGILRDGQLIVVETIQALRDRVRRRLELTFADDPPATELRAIAGIREMELSGRTARLVVEGSMADLFAVAAPHGLVDVVSRDADLEEIFLAYYA